MTDLDNMLQQFATTQLGPQGEPIEYRYSDDQPRDPDGKFASGGDSSVQEKLSTLAEVSKGFVYLPVDQGTPAISADWNNSTIRGFQELSKAERSSLVAAGTHVDIPFDKNIVAGQFSVETALVVEKATTGDLRFPVARVGEKYYVLDGHHRMMAQWAKGQTIAHATLVTLSKRSEFRYSDDQPRDEHGRWESTSAPTTTKAGNPHPHAGKSIEHPSLKSLTNESARLKAESIIQTAIANGKEAGIKRGWDYLRSRALGRDFGESSESYEARNPEIPQLRAWLKEWEAGKEGRSLRYSDDQPRDPDGKFGSGGESGSGMKKTSIPMTSDKEKTEVQKDKAEKSRIGRLLKQYQVAWVKSGSKGTFADYVKSVDVVNSKKIIEADENRYSDDQPRDPNGQFASGAGSENPLDPANVEAFNAANDARFASKVMDEADKQGYPADKVQVSKEDREFQIGDHKFTEGGNANLENGVITIRASLTPDQIAGVMAHEIEHQRFQAALNAFNEEHATLMHLAHDAETWDKYLYASGAVKPEHQASFPVTVALQKALETDKMTLYKEDGCTSYSKSYWEMYEKSGYMSAWGERAMHETLAEMARVKVTTGKFPETSTNWRDLYRSVSKVTKAGLGRWPGGG